MSSDALKSIPFPIPTLDKPFGVELWPIFEQVYTKLMGYPPSAFYFLPGQTPLSTIQATATMLITYYFVVLGGRELMKNRDPVKLNALFMVHNLYLTVASAIMLVLFIEQLVPTVWRRGVFFAICDHRGGWTRELVVLYYMNYLTKYIELVDTVFLVLKKKPLTFLHTYHHGATALLCYTQLIGLTAVSWVPITLNLLVHVVMYWYYFQSARGVRIWWKEWITRLQIVQFVIDLGFVYYASYNYFSSTYFPNLPIQGKCAGEEFAAFAGIGILSSYLLLFISFYLATYKKSVAAKGRRRSISQMGNKAARDMSKLEVPTVEEVIHVGSPAQEKENGSANGSIKGKGTRSRKA
ncbi:Fatty acyl-CoA elongase/Polyunsaturated fatty acid specific elongation enzyme [Xanthoria calcicola]